MSKNQPSSMERVHQLLSGGGRYSTAEIADLVHIQHNTLLKDLKFLRDRGEPVRRQKIKTLKNYENVEYSIWYYDLGEEKGKEESNKEPRRKCPNLRCQADEFFWTKTRAGWICYNCGRLISKEEYKAAT